MERLPIFAERLLLARRRRGLTQEALASQARLFKTDISKYERGLSMPTLPRLVRLAQALHASGDALLGLDDIECTFCGQACCTRREEATGSEEKSGACIGSA